MPDNLDAILARLEPEARAAFIKAINDITSAAQLAAVISHIEAGNVEAVLTALNLRPEFFAPLDAAIVGAFNAGGTSMLAGLPPLPSPGGASVAVRFDGRHERAEQVARNLSSRLVTRIVEDQRDAVRLVVETGIREGWNPRKTALDIVGRVNRATGKREGGILGLNKAQAEAVLMARYELTGKVMGEVAVKGLERGLNLPQAEALQAAAGELKGVPKAAYFDRKLRDKRFDRTVAKAIRDGKPLAKADVDRITQRYSDRLLKHRGDTIARTETIGSLNAGREEGVRQLIDAGNVRPDQVVMVWDATMDARTRPAHMALDGQRRAVGEPFVTPAGYRMLHPGDSSLGAPGSETIGCRCILRAALDFIKGLK